MVAFLIRRMFGMIIVLIAVSLVTYIIFFKIPGGDPAQRIAGRTATQPNIAAIFQPDIHYYIAFGSFTVTIPV